MCTSFSDSAVSMRSDCFFADSLIFVRMTLFVVSRLDSKSAKDCKKDACKYDRSSQELSNRIPIPTSIGFDTAENESLKVKRNLDR